MERSLISHKVLGRHNTGGVSGIKISDKEEVNFVAKLCLRGDTQIMTALDIYI